MIHPLKMKTFSIFVICSFVDMFVCFVVVAVFGFSKYHVYYFIFKLKIKEQKWKNSLEILMEQYSRHWHCIRCSLQIDLVALLYRKQIIFEQLLALIEILLLCLCYSYLLPHLIWIVVYTLYFFSINNNNKN